MYGNDKQFTTQDHDPTDDQRAKKKRGAWWFKDGFESHLNGEYKEGGASNSKEGLFWKDWRGENCSLKMTEMKIKRL